MSAYTCAVLHRTAAGEGSPPQHIGEFPYIDQLPSIGLICVVDTPEVPVRPDRYLYHGDNLDVLRELRSETVDLVYLDPPFKSNRVFNVFHKETNGAPAAAQQLAFVDTWTWDPKAAKTYRQVVETAGPVADCLDAFQKILRVDKRKEMLAYVTMMAPRLVELHRVLKPTGSLYLHCDPTASHYLKVLMDAVFGPKNFRNEIVWLRSKNPKGSQHAMRRFSPSTDTLLYYVRTDAAPIHLDRIRRILTASELRKKYPYTDEIGPYADGPILRSASMGQRPNLVYEYKGFTPGPAGWRVERSVLEQIDRMGNLAWTATGGVRRKLRPEDDRGHPVGSFWGDIPPVNSQAQERLGYPTQKPEPLLARIIAASSDVGGVVLDPCCGCGTTIEVAQRLKRRWIGIDITHRALEEVEDRLAGVGLKSGADYHVDARFAPKTLPDIAAMARRDKYTFQGWALREAGIEPFQLKPGPDRGIDARKVFFDPAGSDQRREIIVSVKGGKLKAGDVRDLIGTVQRERAQIGVLITLRLPTPGMLRDAADVAPYRANDGRVYPAIQVLTVTDLLQGKVIEYPLQVVPRYQVPTMPAVPAPRKIKQSALLSEDEVVLLPQKARMAKAGESHRKPRHRRSS